jgi:hypothetical protein
MAGGRARDDAKHRWTDCDRKGRGERGRYVRRERTGGASFGFSWWSLVIGRWVELQRSVASADNDRKAASVSVARRHETRRDHHGERQREKRQRGHHAARHLQTRHPSAGHALALALLVGSVAGSLRSAGCANAAQI